MTEFSDECKRITSTQKFLEDAVLDGAVFGAYGFFAGEAFFGVGGAPGALIGVGVGELANIATHTGEYISCSINNKTILHNLADLTGLSKHFSNQAKPESSAAKTASDGNSVAQPAQDSGTKGKATDSNSPAKLPRITIQ